MITKKIIFLFILTLITDSQGETLKKKTGFLTFNALEFPATILNYPISINEKWRSKFNETKNNRMFLHTFQYSISSNCKITKAILSLQIKNLSGLYNNDIIGFVENGKVIYKNSIWKKTEKAQTEKMLTYNLKKLPKTGSILSTLNDGDFSFYIQDDTSVKLVKLAWTETGKSCQKQSTSPIILNK